jgi:hypothetical protein
MILRRRIARHDSHNWAIQDWQEGGDAITRGLHAGKEKQSKWKAPEKFYAHLHEAALAMFREIVADNWDITGQALASMLADSEKRIMDYTSSLFQAQKDDLLIGILQERGYVVTSGKKGRTSYVDDAPPDDAASSEE